MFVVNTNLIKEKEIENREFWKTSRKKAKIAE